MRQDCAPGKGHSGIETLLFDLGNVLFPFDWEIALNEFANAADKPLDEIRKAVKNPDYAILFYEYGTGRMSTESFVARLNTALGTNLDFETTAAIWCSIFTPDHRMLSLLDRLYPRYRTFILSDTDPLHWTHLDERWMLEERVCGAILSYRYGSMKADPGSFGRIVKSYRFDPSRTLFIDDLERNLAAAKAAGVQGVLHRNYDETVALLNNAGVITD